MAEKRFDGIQGFLPDETELPRGSEREAQQDDGNQVAWIVANVAIGLFLFFVVVVAAQILPIRLQDPAWILSSADSLTRFMFLPLVGMLLLRIGAALAVPYRRIHARSRFFSRLALFGEAVAVPYPRIHARSRFFSRLALFAAIGYFLLVPLIGFANWRMVRMIQLRQQLQSKRINTNNQLLNQAIDAATSAKDLQLRFQAIGAPPLPEALINQPFVIVKKQAKDFISQAANATKFRATTPASPEVVRIYWQSFQVVLLAMLSAFCFLCTSW
jgi:hypothetical protein